VRSRRTCLFLFAYWVIPFAVERATRKRGRPITPNFYSTIAILATALPVVSNPGAAARMGEITGRSPASGVNKGMNDTRHYDCCNRLTLRGKHPVLDWVCAGIGRLLREPNSDVDSSVRDALIRTTLHLHWDCTEMRCCWREPNRPRGLEDPTLHFLRETRRANGWNWNV